VCTGRRSVAANGTIILFYGKCQWGKKNFQPFPVPERVLKLKKGGTEKKIEVFSFGKRMRKSLKSDSNSSFSLGGYVKKKSGD